MKVLVKLMNGYEKRCASSVYAPLGTDSRLQEDRIFK
jgi:hypothetical protein